LFPEVIFLGVVTEWLLGDENVWSVELESAQKGHNFCFDRWIALKFLQGFPQAVFVGYALESVFSDEDVWSATLSIGSKGP
jgi:hypothetical protein